MAETAELILAWHMWLCPVPNLVPELLLAPSSLPSVPCVCWLLNSGIFKAAEVPRCQRGCTTSPPCSSGRRTALAGASCRRDSTSRPLQLPMPSPRVRAGA
jgi:hypothetical protein